MRFWDWGGADCVSTRVIEVIFFFLLTIHIDRHVLVMIADNTLNRSEARRL